MWTDLGFNLLLLLTSDYFAVLMISNVCYMVFNFLNLQSGWIHRIDRAGWERPFQIPSLPGGRLSSATSPKPRVRLIAAVATARRRTCWRPCRFRG